MSSKKIPFLLIIMMLITPIASAFEHCLGMDMSAHLLEGQSLAVVMTVDDTSPLNHKTMPEGQQNNQADMECHISSGCTLHVCGGYGITPSSLTVNSINSPYYSNYEYISPYNTSLSPDLRPPIVVL